MAHLYEIEVNRDGIKSLIRVEANTRTQAAAKARAAGYDVRSVNMIG